MRIFGLLSKLGWIRPNNSMKGLLRALEYGATDPMLYATDAFIRRRAAQTLGLVGDTRAVDPLIHGVDAIVEAIRAHIQPPEGLGSLH